MKKGGLSITNPYKYEESKLYKYQLTKIKSKSENKFKQENQNLTVSFFKLRKNLLINYLDKDIFDFSNIELLDNDSIRKIKVKKNKPIGGANVNDILNILHTFDRKHDFGNQKLGEEELKTFTDIEYKTLYTKNNNFESIFLFNILTKINTGVFNTEYDNNIISFIKINEPHNLITLIEQTILKRPPINELVYTNIYNNIINFLNISILDINNKYLYDTSIKISDNPLIKFSLFINEVIKKIATNYSTLESKWDPHSAQKINFEPNQFLIDKVFNETSPDPSENNINTAFRDITKQFLKMTFYKTQYGEYQPALILKYFDKSLLSDINNTINLLRFQEQIQLKLNYDDVVLSWSGNSFTNIENIENYIEKKGIINISNVKRDEFILYIIFNNYLNNQPLTPIQRQEIIYDLKKSGDWGQAIFCSKYNETHPDKFMFVSGDYLSALNCILRKNVTTFFGLNSSLFKDSKTSYLGIYNSNSKKTIKNIIELISTLFEISQEQIKEQYFSIYTDINTEFKLDLNNKQLIDNILNDLINKCKIYLNNNVIKKSVSLYKEQDFISDLDIDFANINDKNYITSINKIANIFDIYKIVFCKYQSSNESLLDLFYKKQNEIFDNFRTDKEIFRYANNQLIFYNQQKIENISNLLINTNQHLNILNEMIKNLKIEGEDQERILDIYLEDIYNIIKEIDESQFNNMSNIDLNIFDSNPILKDIISKNLDIFEKIINIIFFIKNNEFILPIDNKKKKDNDIKDILNIVNDLKFNLKVDEIKSGTKRAKSNDNIQNYIDKLLKYFQDNIISYIPTSSRAKNIEFKIDTYNDKDKEIILNFIIDSIFDNNYLKLILNLLSIKNNYKIYNILKYKSKNIIDNLNNVSEYITINYISKIGVEAGNKIQEKLKNKLDKNINEIKILYAISS